MKATTILFAILLCATSSAVAQKRMSRGADTLITMSGLKCVIKEKGTGPKLEHGNVVIAHYIGTFLDGKVFDSSHERNQPFAFTLGRGQVIAGWDEGFQMLNVGDRARFIIPPDLAYGDKDRGTIPANSTLVFDVEVLDIKQKQVVDELMEVYLKEGISSAIKRYREMQGSKFEGFHADESQLNTFGYWLLNQSLTEEAIAIFKLNVEDYPESANVYDSLAEGYMNNGNHEEAIANYTKSLELDPKNSNAAAMLERLLAK
jgi:FKBP-type peptidyl-prolyl cis-trans isomerase 2